MLFFRHTSAHQPADGYQGWQGPSVQRHVETVVREGKGERKDRGVLEGLVPPTRREAGVSTASGRRRVSAGLCVSKIG